MKNPKRLLPANRHKQTIFNNTFQKAVFNPVLLLFVFFGILTVLLLSHTHSFAQQQANSPCDCANRWTGGGAWNADGSVNDTPNANQLPKGLVRCGSHTDSQSNVNNCVEPFPCTGNCNCNKVCTYKPTSFTIDLTQPCLNSSAQVPTPPSPGCEIMWLQFDVRPYAGTWQFQILGGAQQYGWALYASNEFSMPTNANELGGTCNNLSLQGYGVEFPNAWATVLTPDLPNPTNYYLAVWNNNPSNCNSGLTVDMNFRYSCCEAACILGKGDHPPTTSCNSLSNTYEVCMDVIGVNGNFSVLDHTGLASNYPTSIAFGTAPNGPFEQKVCLTYPTGSDYAVSITGTTCNAQIDYTGSSPTSCCDAPPLTCPILPHQTLPCGSVAPPPAQLCTELGISSKEYCDYCYVQTTDEHGGSGSCNDPTTITRTYNIHYDGTVLSCTQTFTLMQEHISPLIETPNDLVINCEDSNLEGRIQNWLRTCTAIAGCSNEITVSHNFNLADLYDVGCTPNGLPVTFFAVDDCGSQTTATANIILQDNTPPTIQCPDNLSISCDGNNNPAIQNWLNSVSATDNCDDDVTITHNFNTTTFNCSNGTTSITFTATDACGNISTCSANIIPNTPNAPTINCPNDLQLSCNQSNTQAAINTWLNGVSANGGCGGLDISNNYHVDNFTGNCGNEQSQVVTFTVNDDCGQSVSCAATIFITGNADDLAIQCPNDLILGCSQLDRDQQIQQWLNGVTATDGCGNTINVSNNYDFDNFNPTCGSSATQTVTFTATDACGNTANCTAEVIIQDNAPPVMDCPDDLPVTCTTANLLDVINEWLNTCQAVDECDADVFISNDFTQSTYTCQSGPTTVVFTATDACGNTSTCSADIIPNTPNAPTIDCPNDLQLSCTQSNTQAAINTWLNGVSANGGCGGLDISNNYHVDNFTGNCGNEQSQVVTFTVNDDCGQSVSCAATIFITGNADDLAIQCPNDLILGCSQLDRDQQIQQWLNGVTATDGCGNTINVSNNYDFDNFNPTCGSSATQTVTFTATDACGNTTNCIAEVIIQDNAPPVIDCPDDLPVTCTTPNLLQVINEWLNTCQAVDECDADVFISNDFTQSTYTCQSGPTTVVFTATDACGNTSTCSADIIPTTPDDPTINCPDDLQLSCGENNHAAIQQWLDSVSANGGCGNLMIANNYHENSFTGNCGTQQSQMVTFTVTDACGEMANCTANIFITGNSDDVAIQCPNDLILGCSQLDRDQQIQQWLNGVTATDGCGNTINVSNNYDFDNFNPTCGTSATQTVTFTATDACGNTANCTAEVIIQDNAPPVMDCPDDLPVTCTTPNLLQVINEWLNTCQAVDECDADVFISNDFTQSTYTCQSGPTTVVFTATDACGNTSTCSADIIPTTPDTPTINCPDDLQLSCGVNNNASIQQWLDSVSANGGCGNLMIANNYHENSFTGNCGTQQSQMVTFTVTDACGEMANCTANIFITGNSDDVAVHCPNDLILGCNQTDAEEKIHKWLQNVSATDGCGNSMYVSNDYEGNNFAVTCGASVSQTVTFSTINACGQSATCTAQILVQDNAPPVIECPDDLVVSCDSGNLLANINQWLNTATAVDECDENVTISHNFNETSYSCQNGTVSVTFTATDACGNSTTCSANIIPDTPNIPNINCPDDLQLSCTQSNTQAAINTWLNGVSANGGCGSLNISNNYHVDNFTGNCATSQSQVVTFTLQDDCGQSVSCSATIFIGGSTDDVTLHCPNDLILGCSQTDRDDQIIKWLQNVAATDGCGNSLFVSNDYNFSNFSPTCGTSASQTVTFSTIDACGNTANCTAEVIIQDNAPPVINCPDDLPVSCTMDNLLQVINEWLNTCQAVDECDENVFISNDFNQSTYSCEGSPTTVTFTATDACGNTSTCAANIIPTTPNAPAIDCPDDLQLSCGANNNAVIQEWLNGVSANGGCGNLMIANNYHENSFTGNCGTQQSQMVTFTVTDACGEMAYCTANIFITGNPDDVAVHCPNDLILGCNQTDAEEKIHKWLQNVSATDGCGNSMYVSNDYEGNNFAVTCGTSVSQTVTFSTINACGQSATCTAQIIVQDNAPPIIDCPDDLQLSCAAGNLITSINEWLNTATATDECDENVTISHNFNETNYSCQNGTVAVTFTATDACGNTSTCAADIIPNTPNTPTVNCPDDLQLSCGENNHTAIQQWLNSVSANSSCGGISISNNYEVDNFTGNCGSEQSQVVTFTIQDNCGYSVYCSATIFISGNTDDLAIHCPNDLILGCSQTDRDEQIHKWLQNVGATDACGNSLFVSNNYSFANFTPTCGTSASQTVTFNTIDACGNTANCTAEVIIQDNAPPIIECPDDLPVSCTMDNLLQVINEWLNTCQAVDECDENVFISNDFNQSTYSCEGSPTTVTFTATDACGNTSTCSADITPTEDPPTPLTIDCPNNLMLPCNQPNQAALIETWLAQVSTTGGCGLVNIVNDYHVDNFMAENCANSTWQTVTFTATDMCGTQQTCTSQILIIDQQAAVFDAPLPPTEVTLTYEELLNYELPSLNASDGCGGAVTIDVPELPSLEGCIEDSFTLTWTATDECGNESHFTQTISISNANVEAYINSMTNIVCGTSNSFTVHASGISPFTYQWTSDNDSWQIVSGDEQAEVVFTAGTSSATFEVAVTDDKGCTQTFTITRSCEENDDTYCTFTQGFYGNEVGRFEGQTTLEILQDLLSQDINGDGDNQNDPLFIGTAGQSLSIGYYQAACLFDLLPGGGPSQPLPTGDVVLNANCNASPIDIRNDGTFNNALLSQTITLMLNVRYDPSLCYLTLSTACLDIPTAIYQTIGIDATVCDLIELANSALGGETSINLGYINHAIAAINDGFNECQLLCGQEEENGNEKEGSIHTFTTEDCMLHAYFDCTYDGDGVIEIFSYSGQQILHQPITVVEGENHETVNICSLPAAIYILRVTLNNQTYTVQFFIE